MKRILIAAALAASASAAKAQAIPVTLTEFKLDFRKDTVPAGAVTFRVKNAGAMTHGFYVRGPGVAKGSPDIPAKQEVALTVTLKPGTYEIYCPMSDMSHKVAGMTKSLVVIAAPAAPAKKKPGN